MAEPCNRIGSKELTASGTAATKATGTRAFVLVDAEKGTRQPAFDPARMATALQTALKHLVEAEHLPIDGIDFIDTNHLRVQVQEKTFVCDLATYALTVSPTPLGRAGRLRPSDTPRSRSGGPESMLTFSNTSNAPVRLFWLDEGGARVPYGTLAPGATKLQHTFAGHSWLAAREDGTLLEGFVADETPTLAVIDGTVVSTPPASVASPRRRRTPAGETGGVSPDRKWRVVVRANRVFLHDQATSAETPLTRTVENDTMPAEAVYEDRPVWSPDSSAFVLMRTVPAQEHHITLIESSPSDQEQPKRHDIDYLKPGDRIAHPRPCLFTVADTREIPVVDTLFPNPWDISELNWEPDSRSFTFLYNQRGHQVMRLLRVDRQTGAVRTVIDEQASTFIDYTNKVFLHRVPGTTDALWMSERSGWNHLYLYDTATGTVKNTITKGEWVVRGVDKIDDDTRQIYFRAGGLVSGEDPYYVHYCRVNFDGSGLVDLTPGDGTHTIAYSPDRRFLVDTFSRVDQAPVSVLRRVSDGKALLPLEKGDLIALTATGWRVPERFVAPGRDGKTPIYGVIYRPKGFDPKRHYPVVENIYAGPQGAFVPTSFSVAVGSQNMANHGFIVVQIDGMGTNFRSRAFHDVCFKNLADGGFPDRIRWIRAAAAKYGQMDLSRVGIYGTSAGGQNALSALLRFGDFYKVGVADCGCHDNRMDKIWWNEQWMGWPVGPEYAANSNVTAAAKLTGKLLLMVGEMDSNVDPASTYQVVDALIKADKDFDLLVMPGRGHGVAGTPYGQRRLTDFLLHCLRGDATL